MPTRNPYDTMYHPIVPHYYHKRLRPGMKLLGVTQQSQSYTQQTLDLINLKDLLKKNTIGMNSSDIYPHLYDDINITPERGNSMARLPMKHPNGVKMLDSTAQNFVSDRPEKPNLLPESNRHEFFEDKENHVLFYDLHSSIEFPYISEMGIRDIRPNSPPLPPITASEYGQVSNSGQPDSKNGQLSRFRFTPLCNDPTIYDLENYLIQLINISGEEARESSNISENKSWPFMTQEQIPPEELEKPAMPISFMVTCPPNINPTIWLYQHLKRICVDMNYIGLLLAREGECNATTKKSCEKMMIRNIKWESTFSQGDNDRVRHTETSSSFKFSKDENEGLDMAVVCPSNIHTTPEHCSAIDYIWHTLDWSMGILTSSSSIKVHSVEPKQQQYYHGNNQNPQAGGHTPPYISTQYKNKLNKYSISKSNRKFNLVFKRLFLIFNHLYFHHLEIFKKSIHLYKRMLALGVRFDLISTTCNQNQTQNQDKINNGNIHKNNIGVYNIPYFASFEELQQLTFGHAGIGDYDYESELNKIICKINKMNQSNQ